MATEKKILKQKVTEFLGTGRRKKAIARVRLVPNGKGAIIINKEDIDTYFQSGILKLIVRQPLELLGVSDQLGSIEKVKKADLLLMDKEFNVIKTMVSGKVLFDKEEQ